MKIAALIAGIALATGVMDAGAAGRFRPAAPDYVVMRVPARSAADPIAMLEQQRDQSPGDEQLDARLAQLYLDRARAERQPRYFARAEAILQPWIRRADASAATLRLQADILQNRHEFGAAVELLDRALARDPRDASARLMRASVRMVQGQAMQARPDCAAVLAAGQSMAGTICLAQALGATGGLSRADALLSAVIDPRLTDKKPLPVTMRSWALWLLADFADRRGRIADAEARFRAALSAAPENEGIRSALSDLLSRRGAHREALALLDVPAPSIGLLARRAREQSLLHDSALTATRAEIDELLTLSRRRGEMPHLREEALIALDIDHDAPRALALAKANFRAQRETLDARLLIRAALACNDRSTIAEVSQWMRQTGYEDRALMGGQA